MGELMQGFLAIDGGFALQLGNGTVYSRRLLDASAVAALKGFTDRYSQLLNASSPEADLLALGRELYAWLDGDDGQLQAFLRHAARPLRFEVGAANRAPTAAEWTLLRAPWELLADAQGFLAGDVGLGFSPVRRLGRRGDVPALGEYRLGLAFMAASPQGIVDLDYEAEETAIMKVVEPSKLDLLVEESGNPQELGERLAEYPPMQVVHLSCHGHNAWRAPDKPEDDPRPVLFLETLAGTENPTDAGALIGALGAHPPRLVFLSACLSAAAAGGEQREGPSGDGKKSTPARSAAAHSLAESLVDAGLPALLGWDGSVADAAATAFAARLYGELADQRDLADAVALARRDLLNGKEAVQRRDWHLARLWLGPLGGGPLVGGPARRPMMPATHGSKEFLIKERRQAPVASHEMFVGRRRELQDALQALEGKVHAGVLLTGMGRLGKSSLASRIANRRRDLRLAVVFGQYDAPGVLAALSEALQDSPKARDLLQAGTKLVADRPERLAGILKDLLCGPCARGDGGTPVLLVIDDLDQILVADPGGGRHRVASGEAPILAAVIEAFDAGLRHGPSRLVVTSRYRFALNGLEARLLERPLPPLSATAQRKLELRQREAAVNAGLSEETLEAREALLEHVQGVAHGNPGLQDLLGRRLILSDKVPVERAEQALAETAAWFGQGDLPSEPEVRDFLKQLGVDELINLAGQSARTTLRRLTLFDLPIPQSVVDLLIAMEGSSQAHLHDLGLIDVFEDLVASPHPAFAVNALAAGRLKPLSDTEQEKLARSVAQVLLSAWGGWEGHKRPYACDLQLTRIGLLGKDSKCVAACATDAVIASKDGPAAEVAALGEAAIALLDAHRRDVPWRLLSETAAALARRGEGAGADRLLARGMAALEEQRRTGAKVDATAAIFLIFEQAQRMVHRGELAKAQELFSEVVELARAVGDELSAVTARGAIASILVTRGDLDEALRIRRDEELPVYERFGDIRSRAIAIGEIADILEARGELDEVLRIRLEEQLPVFERLGDVRERAVTIGQVADILRTRGDLDEAMRIHREEELPVYEQLGDVRDRAITLRKMGDIDAAQGRLDEAIARYKQACEIIAPLGAVRDVALFRGAIADILQGRGELDEALRIRREEELPVYERLGDIRARADTIGQIADILQGRGEMDEALRIRRQEQLPAYERLGDGRMRAIVMGKIADILHVRGDLDEELRIRREEELPVYERLGDERSHAITMGNIADILETRGELDEALRIRQEQLPVFERLGDIRDRAIAVRQIGDIDAAQGRLDEAIARYEQACEIIAPLGAVRDVAVFRGRVADILQERGEMDEALRIRREEELPVYERLGDVHSRAIAMGSIADILHARGELDEALRIRREEELPAFERLGDIRSCAIAKGKIADILQERGELDEALRICREELQIYERLGDVRSHVITKGKIADILQERGELDEALRIRREELPIYERLGDMRSHVITLGQIADILQGRGELDEALRIRREQELPAYERLGDDSARAVAMGQIADILKDRGELDEALRIRREEQLPINDQLGEPYARALTMGSIADILTEKGDLAAARVLQAKRLEIYRGLSDAAEIAPALWNLALLDVAEEKLDEARPHLTEAYDIEMTLGRAEGIAAIGMMLAQLLGAEETARAGEMLRRSAEMFRKLGSEQEAQEADDLLRELNLG